MLVLSVPGDLSIGRDVTSVRDVSAVTFDFGNTLLAVDRATLSAVVETTARAVAERLGPWDVREFIDVWAIERERQFREEVPAFREVDLGERFVRVLARLRGFTPPAPDERWDEDAAAAWSTPDEIAWAVDACSDAFVRLFTPRPGVRRTLEVLAGERTLAIVSNWPHARTVDRFAEAAGWTPYLATIVVSQRVGTIKPHGAIFEAARSALGAPEPEAILHVGDDWAADVVGAAAAGWRTAYITGGSHDSPLPSSGRDSSVVPDLEIDRVDDLPRLLGSARRAAAGIGDSPD